MRVYIFPSRITQHVTIAVENKLWAIRDISPSQRAARRAKAKKMLIGSEGLFYVSHRKAFTVPFIISSVPEEKKITGIWPGIWHFPFQIEPMGLPSRFVSLERAAGWRNSEFLLSGSMAFVPSEIDDFDWKRIKDELCA